jgi:para-aminobenzoate synthetase/4-amino-4-deoxychorismate lyase
MEIIRTLEEHPRGIYCGAIGHLRPDGDLSLNVAIRTITIDAQGNGVLGIGGGLVVDSQDRAEYAECLLKSAFLTQDQTPFALIESFRWSPQEGYVLLTRHLERLARSAAYFGFVYDEAEIRARLAAAAAALGAPRRVRLTSSETGQIAITVAPLAARSDRPWTVMLSRRAVCSTDPFLYHKTTRRAFFEAEGERLYNAYGADEALFVNERNELTEGSRTNIFIERDGMLLTPAQECGLLPGTLRAQLIAEGKAREAVLTPADLAAGAALFLGNAVRGLLKAQFIGSEDAPTAS